MMTAISRADIYRGEHLLDRMLEHRSRSEEPVLAEVGGSRILLPLERRFGDVAAAQAYVDKVCALPSVRAAFPRAGQPVRVRTRKGQKRAHYEHIGVIALPEGIGRSHGLRETTVLHELAHHLTCGHGHDETWQNCLLFLLETAMGPEAALVLRMLWAGFA